MNTRNSPETPFTKLKRSREIWVNGSASFQTMLKLLGEPSKHDECIRSFGLEVKQGNVTTVRGTSDAWQKWFAEYHPQGDETYKTFKYNYLKKDKTEKGMFTLRNADEEFPLDGTKLRKLYGYGTKSKWVRVPVADEPIARPESPFAKPDLKLHRADGQPGTPRAAGLDADEETAIALAVLSSNSQSPTEPQTPNGDSIASAFSAPLPVAASPKPAAARNAKRKTPAKTPSTPKTPKRSTPKAKAVSKRQKVTEEEYLLPPPLAFDGASSVPTTPNLRAEPYMDSPYRSPMMPVPLPLTPLEQKSSFLVTPPGAKYPHLVTCSFENASELLDAIMGRPYAGESYLDRASSIDLVVTDSSGVPQYVLDKDTDVHSVIQLSGQQKICVRMEWKGEPVPPTASAATVAPPVAISSEPCGMQAQVKLEDTSASLMPKVRPTTPVVTFTAITKGAEQ